MGRLLGERNGGVTMARPDWHSDPEIMAAWDLADQIARRLESEKAGRLYTDKLAKALEGQPGTPRCP